MNPATSRPSLLNYVIQPVYVARQHVKKELLMSDLNITLSSSFSITIFHLAFSQE
jgi:hypothetical protein